MKIKNLTVKPIGFGSTVILPDEVGTLPQGYGENHPTVKYYLSRKWIKEIGGTGDSGNAPAVNVAVNVNTGDENPNGTGGASSENPDGTGTGTGTGTGNGTGGTPDGSGASTNGADNGAGGNSNSNKSLERMNKEELQALAFQRGIQFVEAETRQVLIDKIKAAQNGNE